MMPGARKTLFIVRLLLAACSLQLAACDTIDLYEKVVSIPKHDWQSNFKPQFNFTIKDTNSNYQMFVILRHNEKYNYNNIWLNLTAQAPGTASQKFMLELPLATTAKGWLGSAMDDLYEHRIGLTLDTSKFNFKKSGEYNFTVEQVMREDPLQNVLNVGLRIEKQTP
ncbi:MAG: gliding motility lipoprotein GldH [Flavisolibacter sp.]